MVTVAAAALVLVGCAAPPPAWAPHPVAPPLPSPADPTLRVAFYGDSLAVASLDVVVPRVRSRAPGWDVLNRTHGGTAPCDWLSQMAADAAEPRWRVRVVVLSFVGNMLTRCTAGAGTFERYRRDLDAAVALWAAHGVRVVLVAPPGPVGSAPEDHAASRAAAAVAATRRVPLVELAGSFVDPVSGRFAQRLPCRPVERCDPDGQVVVRSPDGVHLCDHDAVRSYVCGSSPGAVRYGVPVADAAVAATVGVVK